MIAIGAPRKDATTGRGFVMRVRPDGSITVRGSKGKSFNSPSLAAIFIVGQNMNGWWFWQFERSPGEWVRLTHLRD